MKRNNEELLGVRRLKRLVVLVLCCFMNLSCGTGGGCLDKDSIEKMLLKKIRVGDTRVKIESVLNSEGIGFSYDRFRDRYQATIRNEECDKQYKAISVYLYLDKTEKLSKLEVLETFTMP